MKASQPACRASLVGVKRAGPVTGLARFRVIIPLATEFSSLVFYELRAFEILTSRQYCSNEGFHYCSIMKLPVLKGAHESGPTGDR